MKRLWDKILEVWPLSLLVALWVGAIIHSVVSGRIILFNLF